MLISAIRVLAERAAAAESRLAEHDRQISMLEDAVVLHEATLAAFGQAMSEIAALRRELAQLSGDVAEAHEA